jgi:glutamine synthetase
MKAKKLDDMEYVDIVFTWEINGKPYQKKVKRLYSRGRGQSAFDLESAAAAMYMWDRICCRGTTYAREALAKLEKILPSRDGATAESLFQKYWIHSEETIEEEFEKVAKRYIESGWCTTFEEYLKSEIAHLCDSFSKSPLSAKQGWLYFLYKYYENSSVEEIRKDIEQIPEKIKQMVEELISESNERQEELKKRFK